tara:strand:+ start:179 stop:727 length:549 start_codon:yes stop_codon:yes gene_type:complete
MKKFKILTLTAAVAALSLGAGAGAKADDHSHQLKNAEGAVIGSVMLKEAETGVLITIDAMGMTEGSTHAVHIHETGKCAPDFTAAGGHFNPAGHNHGMMDAEGQHAGDMPNLHADAEGKVKTEILNTMITLDDSDTDDGRHTIHDADGSALIIHMGADDYASQPTGDAGDRLACVVLAEPKE